jgi:hypothetical protein
VVPQPLVSRVEVVADVPGLGDLQPGEAGGYLVDVSSGKGGGLGRVGGGVATRARPLVARHGFRPVLTSGLVASAAGLLVLADAGASPMWVAEIGLALLGAGIAGAVVVAVAAVAVYLALPDA